MSSRSRSPACMTCFSRPLGQGDISKDNDAAGQITLAVKGRGSGDAYILEFSVPGISPGLHVKNAFPGPDLLNHNQGLCPVVIRHKMVHFPAGTLFQAPSEHPGKGGIEIDHPSLPYRN